MSGLTLKMCLTSNLRAHTLTSLTIPSNIMWEDSDVNRPRGAQEMTDTEILTAQLDNGA